MNQSDRKKINVNKKKLIIFDMDGTLYNFKEGSFKKSGLQKRVLENAKKYIMKNLDKSEKEAELLIKEITKEYREDISIALEKKFGLDRHNYFNEVWNIPAKNYIQKNFLLRKELVKFKNNFNFVLLSDAPKIWIDRVLKELRIEDIFEGAIFSGEGDVRKGFGNAFGKIIKIFKAEPEDCIVFGDQEETEIIPAKKLGIKTVFVNQREKSSFADYNIRDIMGIRRVLELLVDH